MYVCPSLKFYSCDPCGGDFQQTAQFPLAEEEGGHLHFFSVYSIMSNYKRLNLSNCKKMSVKIICDGPRLASLALILDFQD